MSFQAYLDNVQAKTGKSAEQLKQLAKKKGLVEFKDLIAWLKEDFDLGLGHARAIVHYIQHGTAEAGKPPATKKGTKAK